MKIYFTFIASNKNTDFEIMPADGAESGKVVAMKGCFDVEKPGTDKEFLRVLKEMSNNVIDLYEN